MMTPQEVASCTFAKAPIGGYNMAAVDDFLDKLTDDYAALYKENNALKAKMKVLVDKMEEYREMEDAMRSTLLTAQKMATTIVSEAESKRDAILSDAASGAKMRMAEIEQELASEEARLVRARTEVDNQIAQEGKRLMVAREALQAYVLTVEAVCRQQLDLLEKLPEMPMAPVAAEVPVAPAPVEEKPTPAVQEEAAPAMTAELEKDLEEVFAAFQAEEEPAKEEPVIIDENIFDMDEDEDVGATRVLKLDDLQFGRNYTKD